MGRGITKSALAGLGNAAKAGGGCKHTRSEYYNDLFPQLTSEATNPQGYGTVGLNAMNTANQQSMGDPMQQPLVKELIWPLALVTLVLLSLQFQKPTVPAPDSCPRMLLVFRGRMSKCVSNNSRQHSGGIAGTLRYGDEYCTRAGNLQNHFLKTGRSLQCTDDHSWFGGANLGPIPWVTLTRFLV